MLVFADLAFAVLVVFLVPVELFATVFLVPDDFFTLLDFLACVDEVFFVVAVLAATTGAALERNAANVALMSNFFNIRLPFIYNCNNFVT